MIIDFHAHIIDFSWLPERWWKWLSEYYGSRRSPSLHPGRGIDGLVERFCDPDGSRLLKAMETAGIDRSVVLPLDWGMLLGEPPVSIEEQHRRIAAMAQGSNGKIIPFVGVDPRRKGSLALIRSCLDSSQMRGIKLYPAAGYDIRNREFRPIFEMAREFEVPVLLHTGYSFGPFLSEYSDPSVLDFLCATYPEVQFIAAHLGSGFLEPLCWLGYAKPNLYADCSLMQIRTRQNFPEFARNIRLACDLFGSRRLLFGTDWPFSQSIMPNRDYVNAFGRLLKFDNRDAKFAGYEIRHILGESANSLLKNHNHKEE